MAQERIERLGSFFELWNRGDYDAMADYLDPAITIDWSESNAPYRGIYSGMEGYRRLFEEIRLSFEGARVELHRFTEAGPHVAVANTAHLRGRDGIEVTARSTIVMTYGDDDRTVAVKLFQREEDALRAIGAEPGG